MQHLNIPLSRSTQTTRRSRWVVWLSVCSFIGILTISLWISHLYFKQDAIYASAPDQTAVMMRFFIDHSTSEQLTSLFSNIPLVTERGLLLSDLAPYLHGEFAVFISKEGEQTFAGRIDIKQIPNNLLDSYNIIQKQTKHGVTLLSRKIEPVGNSNIPKQFFPKFSTPWKKWAGEIIMDGKRGNIYFTKAGIEVTLKQKNASIDTITNAPDNLIGYLSTPLLPIETSDPVIHIFSSLLSPFFQNGFESVYTSFFGSKPKIYLTKDQLGIGFLLVEDAKNMDNQLIEKTLRTIVAINSPKIEKKILNDQTMYQEMIADPETISPEQITLFGSQLYRISTKNQQILAGILNDHQFVFTNRESLLKSIKEKSTTGNNSTCGGKQVFLSLIDFSNLHAESSIFPQTSLFEQISQHFSKLGVEQNRRSTTFHLCF